jgi:hypothetical protein
MKDDELFPGRMVITKEGKEAIVLKKVDDKWLLTFKDDPTYNWIMNEAKIYAHLFKAPLVQSVIYATLELLELYEEQK